jgi:L-ascorbate metabolism protein UlaG (beta-lactamase superfamily)
VKPFPDTYFEITLRKPMAILKSLGKNPWGKRLDRIKKSPNYRNDIFQNESVTLMMVEKGAFLRVLKKFLNKPADVRPPGMLPSIKTNLKKLPDDKTTIVWFGHSSYLIKTGGKHILVDPVFSGYASPFNLKSAKSFEGTDIYHVDDMPFIDVLLITHDHYDHCDYKTILKLGKSAGSILTSLGVGSHLEYWGIDPNKITELDWHENYETDGLKFIAVPARHFSGRTFKRSKTLWSSFILNANNISIYIGADSGYDKHFKLLGDKYGPFDLAILESGQYNEDWKLIHMFPEETVRAASDLKAKMLLPVHWGKFTLAFHPWNEPIERVIKKAAEMNANVLTPVIGEPVIIGEENQTRKWWKDLF